MNEINKILKEIDTITRNGYADGNIPYEEYVGITEGLKKANKLVKSDLLNPVIESFPCYNRGTLNEKEFDKCKKHCGNDNYCNAR